ncbi:hypothetical protein ACQRIU_003681 [Beauveria bassiana]
MPFYYSVLADENDKSLSYRWRKTLDIGKRAFICFASHHPKPLLYKRRLPAKKQRRLLFHLLARSFVALL